MIDSLESNCLLVPPSCRDPLPVMGRYAVSHIDGQMLMPRAERGRIYMGTLAGGQEPIQRE